MNDYNCNPDSGNFDEYYKRRHNKRVVFGIILVIVGVGAMLHMMHLLPWVNINQLWPIGLIVMGLVLGFKNRFRNNAWWILIVVGLANITPEFMLFGRPSEDYLWPIIIIGVGLALVFRPRGSYRFKRRFNVSQMVSTEGMLMIDTAFGGKKQVVTAKDFKGGTVNVSFGGVELNLVQADFTEPSVTLEMNVSFSGVELIIPSHWEVQNEISPSFGSVEDKRTIQTTGLQEPRKILILRGSCAFGGIEIKSY